MVGQEDPYPVCLMRWEWVGLPRWCCRGQTGPLGKDFFAKTLLVFSLPSSFARERRLPFLSLEFCLYLVVLGCGLFHAQSGTYETDK